MNWVDRILRKNQNQSFDIYNREKDIFKQEYEETGKRPEKQDESLDYAPMQITVKLPKRKRATAVQTVSDYYIYKSERYWECDGIIFRGINKLTELIMQSGFEVIPRDGIDIKDVAKFNTELQRLLRNNRGTTNYMIRGFLRRGLHDTCLYGNAFIQKKFDPNTGVIERFKYNDPLSMSVLLNKDTGETMYYATNQSLRKRGDIEKQLNRANRTSKYYQYAPRVFYTPRGDDERLSIDNLLHIKYLDISQNSISIPPSYPALGDILSLRTIEDDIGLVAYQYGHPFLHATINSEDLSPAKLRQESAFLKEQIENMEGNGMIVTTERVTVNLKGPQGNFPDLTTYHELFRKRTEKGLGIPDLFTGEGGGVGRQTSDTVEMSMYAFINDFGHTYAEQLQIFVDELFNRNIRKMGNKDSGIYDQSPIEIKFKESDRLEKRSEEQHAITLWQSNAISHKELRERLGEPIDTKLQDKYWYEVDPGNEPSGDLPATSKKVRSQISPTNQTGASPAKSKKD